MALFVDLVALSNGLHGSVQMDSVALFSWIGWLRHHGILNKESLCEYRDSISATRIKTISNKIARLMESYFDAQEIAVLSQILKLAVVDITSDHIYYPTIPEEVVDIIERNGLHYE